MLYKEFEQYIAENKLFSKTDKLLLALSGGSDSIALFHLLKSLNYTFAAAHCNFKLRGVDSDKDEIFVKNLCEKHSIKLFCSSFNTRSYAKLHKLSLEEAARELRYKKFEEIRQENHFSYILTAHHLDDKIETFFINLTKGTGIKGLRSIKAKNNKIVRPLLFARKEQIDRYCADKDIAYRTDFSNFDTNFLRNKFRHEILPAFTEINPDFKTGMQKNFKIFSELENIYNQYIETETKKLTHSKNKLLYINIQKLLQSGAALTLLFETLRPYNFSSKQSEEILKTIEHIQTGKQFFSKTHRILKTPAYLVIDSLKSTENKTYSIPQSCTTISSPLQLSFDLTEIIPHNLKTDVHKAYINADKLNYPLKIRQIQEGDYFYPFGMKGKKLLSDFFTDKKINSYEREKIFVLTNADNAIIWLIGYRTDERFRIHKSTKKILIIKQF